MKYGEKISAKKKQLSTTVFNRLYNIDKNKDREKGKEKEKEKQIGRNNKKIVKNNRAEQIAKQKKEMEEKKKIETEKGKEKEKEKQD
jgi:hypothetical protein